MSMSAIVELRAEGLKLRKRREHLNDAGETYFRHLLEAWRISLICSRAALAAFVHGFFPNVFEETATRLLRTILDRHAIRLGNDGSSRGVKAD